MTYNTKASFSNAVVVVFQAKSFVRCVVHLIWKIELLVTERENLFSRNCGHVTAKLTHILQQEAEFSDFFNTSS